MSKNDRVVRFHKAARGSRPASRAQFYASRRGALADDRKRGSFAATMVLLPLAAFSAVFLWNGPPPSFAMGWSEPAPSDAETAALYHASAAELARKRWPTTPAMLDGAQPDFSICGDGARVACVVDGDTFWHRGEKIRIADINAPEVGKPGCRREASLGAQATQRLQVLLNDGAFSLGLDPSGRDTDRYGRKLRTVQRDGESIGRTLVEEGLAETWKGRRSSWC